MKHSNKLNVKIVLLILFGIAIFISFYKWRDNVKIFAQNFVEEFGYPALFLLTWLSDAIIQPIPADVFVFGTSFGGAHILTTAIVAGVASALGGITGYIIGYLIGAKQLKKFISKDYLKKGRYLFHVYGWWTIFISAVTPIPYSVTCYIGGIYKMPVMNVLVPSLIARTLRYLLFAWLGSWF